MLQTLKLRQNYHAGEIITPSETIKENLIPESDYRQVLKELSSLKAEFEVKDDERKKLQKEVSRLKILNAKGQGIESSVKPLEGDGMALQNVTTPTKSSVTEQVSRENSSATEQHHTLAWFPKFCPEGDCDDEHALQKEFKDETECKGCGMHLGAKDSIRTETNLKAPIVRCPNCGSHDARVISGKKDAPFVGLFS